MLIDLNVDVIERTHMPKAFGNTLAAKNRELRGPGYGALQLRNLGMLKAKIQ